MPVTAAQCQMLYNSMSGNKPKVVYLGKVSADEGMHNYATGICPDCPKHSTLISTKLITFV